MKRILIVKMWALGDIVMATPILSALRARWPDVHITWLIDENNGDLLWGHASIDEVFAVDVGKWRRLLRNGNVLAWAIHAMRIHKRLKQHPLDAVINLHPEKWWTAVFCPAPVRIGLYPMANPNGTRRFYTTALGRESDMHETHQYLRTTQALSCPDAGLRLSVGRGENEAAFVDALEARFGLNTETDLVALAPFSSSVTKSWELERFASVASALAMRHPSVRFIITFSPKERLRALKLAEAISCKHPPIVLESIALWQYVALLRRARLVISGDSSPLHIAAAVGTPFVAIFGSTDPTFLAPLDATGTVISKPNICRPCWSSKCANAIRVHCLRATKIDEVLMAAERYLGAREALKMLQ